MDQFPHPDPSRRAALRGVAAAAAAGGIASLLPAAVSAAAAANPVQPVAFERPASVPGVQPFKAAIPQAALDDLKLRLSMTRWPDQELVPDWSQGLPLARLQALADHWQHHYDWRQAEAKLNAFPQFITRIDGLDIHFLHVRSKHPNALPIVLTHGWPGSVFEFIKSIGPLVDPTAHGGKAEDAFHVVIPSLPGYGFSGKPTSTGWGLPHIARAWATLMRRLGYKKWVAQGGDWGAGVTTWLAKQHADGLAAIHLNLPILFPPPIEGEPDKEEQATIAQLVAFDGSKSGYAKLQGTRPQTIGYALADSPVAQAAWIYEKLGEWTDSHHQPESVLTLDDMLDNISLYWLTDSGASSARLYAESFTTDFATQKLDLPVAVSLFPGELYHPPRKWAERVYAKLYYWNEAARGGHFAAFEQPTLFTAELRRAFATVR
ncbi:pimeloyl-ACP methyl ester carboxylesterase [Duganella sp. 1224]|uniref:epoxide hydrolase family protein n=1 Tax=Duganella sp. 1224 TaxID=2587052 RepID=UPI0015CD4BF1|nr:epoxide hydrolase family protein [Duganella sp. 1224]NYE62774.1 pimeloyl-ACP methyl ester carboxylesterase [Duganella sp. 1224]